MSRDKKGGFGKFILGAAVGAGVALLFAPQEGSKTRKQLKQKIDELVEKAKNIDTDEVKKNIEKKIQDIKNDLKDLDGEKALALAKEKGKAVLRKCDELIKIAIEKGTPVVQRAAEDVRLKTIEVLEDTIVKLEAKAPKVEEEKKPEAKKPKSKKKKTQKN